MERDQTQQPHPETGIESAPAPITVREVLKAVFMPPQEGEPAALTLPAAPQFLRPERDDLAGDQAALPDLAMLSAPTTLTYENAPIRTEEHAEATRRIALVLGTVSTLLIGYFAQSVMSRQGSGFAGALLYGLAMIAWVSLLLFEFIPPDGGLLKRGPKTGGGGPAKPLPLINLATLNARWVIVLSSLALSVLTYFFTADNLFTGTGLVTWGLSITGWMIGLAERDPGELFSAAAERVKNIRLPRPQITRRQILLALAFTAILGVALFFRIYRLNGIPNEMTSDHVEKLLDSYDISQGIYHVFFTRNGGREAIQFYLVALAGRLFGTGMSFLTLKLVTVIEAMILIPLIILLGRELVDLETGYFAAALVAVSWWHVMLARLALRIVLTPLFFTLVLITLIRGIRTGARRSWLWAGLWMGIGLYGYQAMRIVPLVAILAALVSIAGPLIKAAIADAHNRDDAGTWRVLATNTVSRQGMNLILSGLVVIAFSVPMLRVWHDYPDELWNRVINRTTSREAAIDGEPLGVFAGNYIDALQMFNLEGDSSWFSAVPGVPVLGLIAGVLLIMGLATWLMRLRIRRDPADFFILGAGLIMLLPSALAIAFPLENPSATRASGILPIVFVLAAWPLALIRQRWTSIFGRQAGLFASGLLIGGLLLASAFVNYAIYFEQYAASYRKSALNPGEVAAAVRREIGPDSNLDGAWLQGWPFWHDYRAIGIEAGDITYSQAIVDVVALQSYLEGFPGAFKIRPLVFIVHPLDEEALDILRERFPTGVVKRVISETEGRDFMLFVVYQD